MNVLKKLLTVITLLSFATTSAFAAEVRYRAQLKGKNEVPKVKTPATGKLKMALTNDILTHTLYVTGMTSPTAARIHKGKPGQNGPPVAVLYGGPSMRGPFTGTLSEGTINEKNLVGELRGKTVGDLIRLIESGDTYVNVPTETFPAGEIRGPIGRK